MDGVPKLAAPVFIRPAALFIDVPNITHLNDQPRRSQHLELGDINWEALIARMTASLPEAHALYTGTAYLFLKDRRIDSEQRRVEELENLVVQGDSLLSVQVRNKDIDSIMVCDIYDFVLDSIAAQSRRGIPDPYDMTLLIASGDGVFARVVNRIRAQFGSSINLRLHVFSWAVSLSSEFFAVSDHVDYLDTFSVLVKGRR